MYNLLFQALSRAGGGNLQMDFNTKVKVNAFMHAMMGTFATTIFAVPTAFGVAYPPLFVFGLPTLWLGKRTFLFYSALFSQKGRKKYIKMYIERLRPDIDASFRKDWKKISSFINKKGANFRYAYVEDFLNRKGDLYIANMKIANEMKDFLTNKDIEQAEKTEITAEPIDLCKTVLCLGKMGSGKSVFLKNIYSQKKWSRAVINDVKGEYIESFYDEKKDIIYNLYDRRGKVWDILSDVKRNPAMATVIAMAIVSSLSVEKDFRINASTKLLEEAILNAAFTDMNYSAVINYIENYKKNASEQNDKTALSAYDTLQPVLDVLKLIAFLETKNVEKFSIYDFAEDMTQRTLFLLLDPAHAKSMQLLTNALLSALISILLSKPDTKTDLTLFMLDEFLNIKIPDDVLTMLFTTSRSKGIQLVLATPYLPRDVNQNKLGQLILNSRHILAIFKLSEPETLEIVKKGLGEFESVYDDINISFGTSQSTTRHYGTKEAPIKELLGMAGVSKTTGTNKNVSMQMKKERENIIDMIDVLNLPEHHFLYIQADPYLVALAKVEKLYYDFEGEKKPSFEELDLSEYYQNLFTKKAQTTQTI